MKRHPYQSLNRKEFRLLQILSTKPPCFKFLTFSLDNAPAYRALSYTWGSAIMTHTIMVNDSEIPVTDNLFNALDSLSYSFHETQPLLWADGLCIDQEDIDEKNLQIPIMSDIYLKCEWIIAWLDEPSENTRRAFKKIHELADFYESLPMAPDPVFPDSVVLTDAGTAELSPDNPILYGPPGTECFEAWQAIFTIYQHKWWTRTWIMQEATCPLNVLFVCGDDHAWWSEIEMAEVIRRALYWNHHVDERLSDDVASAHQSLIKIRQGRRYRLFNVTGLTTLLTLSRVTHCVDPRDKLYAVLSIASDVQPNSIKVDYGKSVLEVYADFAHWYISHAMAGQELDFLPHAGRYVNQVTGKQFIPEESQDILPSWIPDWRNHKDHNLVIPSRLYKTFGHGDRKGNLVYNATKDYSANIKIERQGRELYLRGIGVDHVLLITDWFPNHSDPSAELEAITKAQGYGISSDQESSREIFCRVLTADIFYAQGRAIARSGLADVDFLGSGKTTLSSSELKTWKSKVDELKRASYGRCLIVTSKGHIGLAPGATVEGDLICVLYGSSVCHTLRSHPEISAWEYIGECYLHGFMDGEALDMLRAGELQEENFVLV